MTKSHTRELTSVLITIGSHLDADFQSKMLSGLNDTSRNNLFKSIVQCRFLLSMNCRKKLGVLMHI